MVGVEKTLYKPGTTKISNKFFKNKVTLFTYKCRCSWCIEGKRHSTTKKLLNTQEQINDYI